MSTISIQLPEHLKQSVEELARKENLSTDEFISRTLSDKVSQIDQLTYLEMRAKRGSRDAFRKILDKAADQEPNEQDRV